MIEVSESLLTPGLCKAQCSPYQTVTVKFTASSNTSYNNYCLQPLEGLLKLYEFF